MLLLQKLLTDRLEEGMVRKMERALLMVDVRDFSGRLFLSQPLCCSAGGLYLASRRHQSHPLDPPMRQKLRTFLKPKSLSKPRAAKVRDEQ